MTPAVVIGGWLGAGKTTLVNHLLRQAQGQRLAVLVNDFGDLVIDADLIDGSAASGDVVALAGGCICCSFGGDLVSALQRVLQRQPAPDRILVEASGVGLPVAIARTARLVQGLSVEGIVVLADATTLQQRAADAYVGDTVRQQLHEADLLLLNKTDLLDDAALAAVERWLDDEQPALPRVRCTQARVPPDLVLAVSARERHFGSAPWPPRAGPSFESTSRVLSGPVDLAALLDKLQSAGPGLLRAKGIVTARSDGLRHLLQGVGRRVEARPLVPGEPAPSDDGLLLIGLGNLARLLPPD